jgi:hypothetical protein
LTWVGVAGFEPAASSSRSQRAMQRASTLTLSDLLSSSVDVRRRPLALSIVVTQLVTRPRSERSGRAAGIRWPVTEELTFHQVKFLAGQQAFLQHVRQLGQLLDR